MARYKEPTQEQVTVWKAWVAELPTHIRSVAERFDPWTLYRLKTSNHRVTIMEFNESFSSVTLTVAVTGQFNYVLHERVVFGIKPDDLEECDLPDPSEILGSVMTQTDVDNNIDALRVMIRPDLWVMGEDGKAQRKQ